MSPKFKRLLANYYHECGKNGTVREILKHLIEEEDGGEWEMSKLLQHKKWLLRAQQYGVNEAYRIRMIDLLFRIFQLGEDNI